MKSIGYLVTTTDLNTMVTAKSGTIANDSYCRTKDYISTNYNVDTSASPYSTYTTNRYPRYQDVVPICPSCTFGTSIGNTINCSSGTATKYILVVSNCGNYELRLEALGNGAVTTGWQSYCCSGGPITFAFNGTTIGTYRVEIRPKITTGTCTSQYSGSFNVCCDTGAYWTNNGSTFCSSCHLYQPQIDTNFCSSTYNQTRNVDLGVNDGCGSWVYSTYCTGCDYYSKETNTCTGNVRNVTLIQSNSPSCGGCCGQSTTPNWVNNGAAYCSGGVQYQPQIDNNACSPTYNQTRTLNLGYQTACCGDFALSVNYNSQYCSGTNYCNAVVTVNNVSVGGAEVRLVAVGGGSTTAWTAQTSPTTTFYGVCAGYYRAEIRSAVNPNCVTTSTSNFTINECYVPPTTTTTTTACTPTTYYALNACSPATGTAYTTIAPGGINQQYVLPGFPNNTFYTYGGATVSSCTPPSGYNGSIQIASGVYGCP
jgi:hypothetical protein